MRRLLGTALLLGGLYVAFVWLTETDFFSKDVRFRVHSEYGAMLNGRH